MELNILHSITGADRRSFSRVECSLKARYRKPGCWNDPMIAESFKQIGKQNQSSLSDLLVHCRFERETQAVLHYFDAKLNLIASQLLQKILSDEFPNKISVKSISGSGVLLEKLDFIKGDLIELVFDFEHDPCRAIFLEGKVLTDSRSYEDIELLPVEFINISEEDREQIIRFVFQEERKNLRRKNDSI